MAEPYTILFVCTGNTCRSPMAEAIARDKLRQRGWDHVEVVSAGISAFGPSAASPGALRAAAARGVDLSAHRAQPLTPDLIARADLVLAMTPSHLVRARELGAADRAALLTGFAAGADEETDPPGVPDPFGGPDEVYRATYDVLEELVEQTLSRLEPVLP